MNIFELTVGIIMRPSYFLRMINKTIMFDKIRVRQCGIPIRTCIDIFGNVIIDGHACFSSIIVMIRVFILVKSSKNISNRILNISSMYINIIDWIKSNISTKSGALSLTNSTTNDSPTSTSSSWSSTSFWLYFLCRLYRQFVKYVHQRKQTIFIFEKRLNKLVGLDVI